MVTLWTVVIVIVIVSDFVTDTWLKSDKSQLLGRTKVLFVATNAPFALALQKFKRV